MLRRPRTVLFSVLLALTGLGACASGAPVTTPAETDPAASSNQGATGYGLNTRVFVESSSLREGDSGETSMLVDVRLSPRSYSVVFVRYATADASARAGTDYRAVKGTLKFNPGELQQSIEIPVIGDEVDEEDEQFVLLLQLVSKAKTGEPVKTIMHIIDDD